jgi:GTP-binding protein
MLVVATKLDATTDRRKLEELRGFCEETGREFHAISAATGEGLKELLRGMADALDRLPKQEIRDEAKETEEVNEVDKAAEDPDQRDSSLENRANEKRSSLRRLRPE